MNVGTGAAAGGRERWVTVRGRAVRLTNLDRVLWPRTRSTKGDMIEYYRSVAERLVSYLHGRPLTLGRFPSGVEGPGWAQTECRGRPDWMPTATIRLRGGGVRRYCTVEDEASLVWVANQGAIELHPFLWRVDRPERPTEVVFDLDPGPRVGLAETCRVALLLKDDVQSRGLTSWVKTTGATGLHVHVPLEDGSPVERTFEASKGFAREVASRLAAARPDLVVDRMRRSLREGRVFIDWMQNDARRSVIAPWSLRATDIPAAATPLPWEAVRRGRLDQAPSPPMVSPAS